MDFSFDKIKSPFLLAVLFLIYSITPGFLLIYIKDKELFTDLDAFKLSVLSLSITLPFILTNSFIIFVLRGMILLKNQNVFSIDNFITSICFASFLSALPLYYVAISIIKSNNYLSVLECITKAIGGELVLMGVFVVMYLMILNPSFHALIKGLFRRRKK